jgi:ABC-type amino acid transport substrate-binding protein
MLGDLITMKRTEGMMREISHDGAAQFRMLAKGRCEAAVSDGAAWLLIDKQHLGHFRMMEKPVQSFSIYHYVNRRHADLLEPLAEAFRALKAEGVSQTLLAPYLAQIRESQARNSVEP